MEFIDVTWRHDDQEEPIRLVSNPQFVGAFARGARPTLKQLRRLPAAQPER